jgi:site-specific recombinase XerD
MLKYKEDYLCYKQTYTSGAYTRYGLWLNKFEDLIGDKDEREVTEQDVFRYKLWMQARHADKSTEYALTILKNYFYYLRLKNIPCLNPELIKSPKARANSRQAVSPDDFHKILAFIEKTIPSNELRYLQYHLIIRILGETGVRVSELTGLMIGDINLEKGGAFIANKKNKNYRWIYWSDTTNELFKKYLPIREHLNRETQALFISRDIHQKGISARTVQRIVKTCCAGAGLDNIVPHSFRHGLAHNVLEKGGNVADVQKMLGHRSPLSSMKYLQYSDIEHERRAKRFLKK